MKRVEPLINEIRELTGTQRYDSDSGRSQYLFVRSLKNAQDSLYKAIVGMKKNFFMKEKLVTTTNAQAFYSFPDDLFLFNMDTIQWSQNPGSQAINYVNLIKSGNKDRVSDSAGSPYGYIPRENGFVLQPPVQAGTLRLSYIRKIPAPEKRSGKISAVTVNGSNQITAMTLDSSEASFDRTYLNDIMSLCVVDRYGTLKAAGILFDSVAANGVVTFVSSQQLDADDGEAVAIGDYVTAGTYTANLSLLPDICESHMIKQCVYETKFGEASLWSKEARTDMDRSMSETLDSLSSAGRDRSEIPISNTMYLEM